MLEVKNGAGQTVKTFNIGDGYAAGDILEVGNGIRITVGTGDFGAGDSFEVDAFATSDTSGLLAAAGMNTFFSGTGAANITVSSDIVNDPTRVATSLGADIADNLNVRRLAELRDDGIADLDDMTAGVFYQKIVTGIGQQIETRRMQSDNIDVIVQNLTNQRDGISGVDINEEAAQMLIFEQMFQAMARYMATIKGTLDDVMRIL
jgi:flagellar hook-associated protein 1 FlgK